ncbi:DUF6538 domain-containing protein [Burkholderia ambifaria]|uniref:DUF6538 domain-containing protein n=1 Tax=Burkholderia ambifaria TaxID=152480 RepID=UPI000F8054ED|nr:DUF6538 domain-containing protein [Burkholderia ambifaria]
MGTTTVTTCGIPTALLHLALLASVKLKYGWKKSNSPLLYFRRRIPDDVKPLLATTGSAHAGKIHYVASLQTSDPWVAAPKVAKLVKETDEDWERLRNPTRAE